MRFLLLPLGILCCLLTSAQDSSFQIKKYKFRTNGFRALAVQFHFSGNTSTQKFGNAASSSDNNLSLSPATVSYTKIRSTDKKLHQSNIGLTTSYQHQKDEDIDRQFKQWNSNLTWKQVTRFYRKNLMFLELGNEMQASWNKHRQIRIFQEEKNQFSRLQHTLILGVGRGRIEQVQDAQMALFLLNDLRKQGLLNGAPTYETTYALATLITDINNRRIFDFRRRRIYELSRLDSFFRSSGLITTTDIRHFTTINDNWSLSINPFRQSGTAFFVRIKPSAAISKVDAGNRTGTAFEKQRGEFVSLGISPQVGVETYVPKNLKWQFNRGANLAYTLTRQRNQVNQDNNGTTTKTNFDYDTKQWELNGFYGIGFFPNNRTQLSANLNVFVSQIKEAETKSYQVQPTLSFGTNYFIGYRTFLSAYIYTNYAYNRYKTGSFQSSSQQQWNSSVSVSLSHVLF